MADHLEAHFLSSELVRDLVIGMSDGLTVPFALAAGLSGAAQGSGVIVTAGFAEIAAGAIAMGLGGYLAGRNDVEHYQSERLREEREVETMPELEKQEIVDLMESYGVSVEASAPLVSALAKNPQHWVDFMMRFELGLEQLDPRRALISALTISTAYVVGGIIPLSPYLLFGAPHQALQVSVIVTLLALAVFGYVKGRVTGSRAWRSSIQTTLIGALAAAAAYAIASVV